MRFSASVLITLVGVAVAAPTLPIGGSPVTGLLGSNDLVGELTGVVSQVENGLDVDGLEKKLDALMGSSLAKVRPLSYLLHQEKKLTSESRSSRRLASPSPRSSSRRSRVACPPRSCRPPARASPSSSRVSPSRPSTPTSRARPTAPSPPSSRPSACPTSRRCSRSKLRKFLLETKGMQR